MKKITLLFAMAMVIAIYCVNAQPYADKDSKDNATRNFNLRRAYNFTSNQIDGYTRALSVKSSKTATLYSCRITAKERNSECTRVYNEFKTNVKLILNPEQYIKWETANQNNDQTRRYKEYLGLDDSGVAQLRKIIDTYNAEIKRINHGNTLYSAIEKRQQTATAFGKRINDLTLLIGIESAKELSNYLDIHFQALSIRRTWTFLTYDESENLAVFYLAFDKEQGIAECSGLDLKTINKKIWIARKKYEDRIKATLKPEQYKQFQAVRNITHSDNLLKRNYQMTAPQLTKYKDIMNRRAIARMIVSKSTLSPAIKEIKYDSIDLRIKDELSKALTVKQAEIWRKNIYKQK